MLEDRARGPEREIEIERDTIERDGLIYIYIYRVREREGNWIRSEPLG
jgi:hypothetical protein